MEPVPSDKPYLGADTYNLLRQLVQIVLPALATLYFGLATQWDLPEPDKVVASITIITTFLGVLLTISRVRYDNSSTKYVGETYLAETNDGFKRVYNITADTIDPNKKELSFKVLDEEPS